MPTLRSAFIEAPNRKRSAMMFCQMQVRVGDTSQIGVARREANRLAAAAGFDEEDCGKASIIASELSTNLSRHATEGEMLFRTFEFGDSKGLEILAIDRGPGITNIARAMEDGYST